MKASVKYSFSIALLVVAFTQCKKDDTIYQGYFYTSNSPTEAQLSLYLDGTYMGALPYINRNQNSVTADSIKKYALPITVKAGKHELQAKDQNANLRSKAEFKVTKNKTSTSGGIGGLEIVSENGELRIAVYF
jgi:hypothetical protein